MKIERTKNASRNIFFGVVLKVYQIIIPFVMRTVMIYFMGVQYTGLNSLFTSVLQVLNLAELGVGSAMTYSMYKPIAEDDGTRICALMKLYRTYYRFIGLVIASIGIFLTPAIPRLIKDEIPQDINIYILYLLNLSVTVLTYWLFAYKNCLLIAHQRNDVTSKVALVTNTIQYVLQFLVLYFFHNYYFYIIILLGMQVITNISTAIVVNILYPDYHPNGKLQKEEVKEINKRIRDLFTSKLGAVIVNSADTIVISAFLGLEMLTIYQNYFFVLSSVMGFISVIFVSCTAGIGNSLVTETYEKNFADLNKFTFIISWVSGFCVCCLLALYQPFMEIWVGNNLMLHYSAVICLCIYFYVYEINALLNMYKDAGGIWRKDRYRTLVTALTNLIMNLILVNSWGIYGVILSTVLSTFFVGIPWILHNLFSTLFQMAQIKQYLRKLIYYVLVVTITCIINTYLCSLVPFNKWLLLIVRLMICCIVPNIIFLLFFYKQKEFSQAVSLIEKVTKGKIRVKICQNTK